MKALWKRTGTDLAPWLGLQHRGAAEVRTENERMQRGAAQAVWPANDAVDQPAATGRVPETSTADAVQRDFLGIYSEIANI